MKRITLAVFALVAVAVVGVAQEPPTPPTRPAPAPRPAPVAPTPRVAPVAPVPFDYDYRLDAEHLREITRQAEQMAREASRIDQNQIREMTLQAQQMAREASRIDQEQVREIARQAEQMARETSRIDTEQLREQAAQQARDAMRWMDVWPTPAFAPMAPIAPMPFVTPMPAPMVYAPRIGVGRDFTDHLAPAPWAQGDPADSVYRIAREALNSGDYGRAARLFNEIVSKYAKSQYQDAAQYYEALARYKIGTTDELHQASKILEPMVAKLPARATTSNDRDTRVGSGEGFGRGQYATTFNFNGRQGFNDSEIAALYARVNGALAQRGDRDAAAKVEKVVATAGTAACDQEDLSVRSEALNALTQMDAATAMPALKRVLDRKDDCSAQLRRSAVFMLARRNDPESSNLLISIAKSDPNVNVRSEAINYLGKLPGETGVNALEEMLRSDQDERIQRAAVRALNSSDNARARGGMRALIDRKDAPMNLRIEAINSFNSDRITAEDAAYLRNLYPKAENDRMKEAILGSLSRIGGADNDQFVLNIAKSPNESSALRSSALSRVGRSPTLTAADLGKLYDAADNYDVRSRVINILGNRKDSESADKLIDIAKTSTVMQLRKESIQALVRRNDPRATQLFMDILDGKKP
jgi:HEAT repeat protein/TolA-binding protein